MRGMGYVPVFHQIWRGVVVRLPASEKGKIFPDSGLSCGGVLRWLRSLAIVPAFGVIALVYWLDP